MDQVIKKQKVDIEMKSLEDLPEEIILKILGQVNIRDLFRCSFVNKKFREIAHDKSLWEKMNLGSNVDVPAELFAKILEKGCEYLSLPFISSLKGTARFENNMKLKYLCFVYSESTKELLEFAATCHGLEKLAFIGDIAQGAFDKLFKCIIQNSLTLKVLNICTRHQLISYESMRLIVTLCQGLTDINISRIQLSQETMDFFCANLTIGIEKLDISNKPTFGNDQLKTLVTRCKTLTELSFIRTNVSDESVDLIIQNLSQSLTKLEVSYSTFSFPNILKIGSMPNLKVFRVWGLPTNEKEELIKSLPHLSDSKRKKGCKRSTNDCFCDSLCIAFPNKTCAYGMANWKMESKLRYY